ncbi:hypothetical protein Tco_0618191 [Tanacetum coccineum]
MQGSWSVPRTRTYIVLSPNGDTCVPRHRVNNLLWKVITASSDYPALLCLFITKDEALDKFKVFKTEVELQQGSLIKRFRTDRGGEYMDTLTESRVLRTFVKLPDPKLKTLGERGIECIFVGYAEHSKAFRFYVIEPNESRSLITGTEDIGGLVVPEVVTDEVVQQPEFELRKSKRNRTPKDFGPEFQLYLIEGTWDENGNQSQDNALRWMPECAGRPAAASRGVGTSCVSRAGRGGQGSKVNDGVGGVPDFSTIIAQQLQNLLLTIVAQVGDKGRGQGDGRNQNGDAVNGHIQEYDGKGGAIVYTHWIEKMESVQDMSGCRDSQRVKYSAGLFVGKALTWWNFEIRTRGREAVLAGTLTDEALRIGSIKKNPEKRGNVGEPSIDRNERDDNKRTRTGNAFCYDRKPY